MRRFKYQDLDGEHVVTAEDIRKNYYDYWSQQMMKAGKEKEITLENCIEDFIIVNWAQEIK